MQKLLIVALAMTWMVAGCSGGGGPGVPGEGFGVSGLLFNNNLVMYDRAQSDRDNGDLVLFPQMYFSNIREANYPVYGKFPGSQLLSGGPGVDGIPAITRPDLVPVSAAGFLADDDLVLGVVYRGEARAYPENILWWHELINDEIGNKLFTISFCPLTGTGLVFDATHARQRLALYPVIETTWHTWKELYPESQVVSDNTGVYGRKRYQLYPYGNYRDEQTGPLFPINRPIDKRYPPKHRVLGLGVGGVRKAYPFATLAAAPVINDDVNGQATAVFFDLPSETAIVYSRVLDDRTLTFDAMIREGELPRMVDRETGSEWNFRGEAVTGPLTRQRLQPLAAHNAFWFAWAAFWPETLVYGE